jgi:hypothetical protein
LNPKIYYHVLKIPPPDPILSQANPFRPIDPYLPKVHLNVILPPTPRSSQDNTTQRNTDTHPCPEHAIPMFELPKTVLAPTGKIVVFLSLDKRK